MWTLEHEPITQASTDRSVWGAVPSPGSREPSLLGGPVLDSSGWINSAKHFFRLSLDLGWFSAMSLVCFTNDRTSRQQQRRLPYSWHVTSRDYVQSDFTTRGSANSLTFPVYYEWPCFFYQTLYCQLMKTLNDAGGDFKSWAKKRLKLFDEV